MRILAPIAQASYPQWSEQPDRARQEPVDRGRERTRPAEPTAWPLSPSSSASTPTDTTSIADTVTIARSAFATDPWGTTHTF